MERLVPNFQLNLINYNKLTWSQRQLTKQESNWLEMRWCQTVQNRLHFSSSSKMYSLQQNLSSSKIQCIHHVVVMSSLTVPMWILTFNEESIGIVLAKNIRNSEEASFQACIQIADYAKWLDSRLEWDWLVIRSFWRLNDLDSYGMIKEGSVI